MCGCVGLTPSPFGNRTIHILTPKECERELTAIQPWPAPPLREVCLHAIGTGLRWRVPAGRSESRPAPARAEPAPEIPRRRGGLNSRRNKRCVLPKVTRTETTERRSCECRRKRPHHLCRPLSTRAEPDCRRARR